MKKNNNSELFDHLGQCLAMRKVINEINLIIESGIPVVIYGEIGTGKTFIAGLIHKLSKRKQKAFVKRDIGFIPENIIEQELYGFAENALTDNMNMRSGVFQKAQQGTVLLYNLENMSQKKQKKLLNVVKNRVIYPIGATMPLKIDLRFISEIRTNINQNKADWKINKELLFRLGELFILIPPLRNRLDDISFLAGRLLATINNELTKKIKGISAESLSYLKRYDWPGNLTELKTVLRNAALRCRDDVIKVNDLDLAFVRYNLEMSLATRCF